MDPFSQTILLYGFFSSWFIIFCEAENGTNMSPALQGSDILFCLSSQINKQKDNMHIKQNYFFIKINCDKNKNYKEIQAMKIK